MMVDKHPVAKSPRPAGAGDSRGESGADKEFRLSDPSSSVRKFTPDNFGAPLWFPWPLPSMAPLAHTLALLALTVATVAIKVLPLDMAQNSFDDQYRGCRENMLAALPALKESELQQNKNFSLAWAKATAEWRSRGSPVSPLPSPAHAIALMAYTMRDLYRDFNSAVREAGSSHQQYRDNFHYKTLHFLLTDALERLRRYGQCHGVYRGVRGIQFTAKRGDTVRFSQFASTSLRRDVAERFGKDTIFQVYTCQGAPIVDYSQRPSQLEVLIPPFEAFKVTDVTQKGNTAEIRLRSNGTLSNYNCEWLRGGSISRDPPFLGGLLLATAALAVATGTL